MPEYYLVTKIFRFFQIPNLFLKYCRQDNRHGSPHWYNWVRPDRKKLGDDLCQRGLQGETVCLLAFKIWTFSLFALYIVISPSQVVLYDVDAGQVILKENFTSKLWKHLFPRLRELWATSRRSWLSLRRRELWGDFFSGGHFFLLWWPLFFYFCV